MLTSSKSKFHPQAKLKPAAVRKFVKIILIIILRENVKQKKSIHIIKILG